MTKLQSTKSTIRRVASWLLCVVVTLASVTAAAAPVRADEGGGSASLKDLVIDKVYQLYRDGGDTVGFDPAVTDYTGTAYLSVNRVNVYPFTPPGVTATVNGQALEHGKASVDLTSGDNAIVVVTSGATTADSVTYTVTVNKVETDYRGRTPIPADNFVATTDFGNSGALKNMFDADPDSYWSPTDTPQNEAVEGDGTGTSFLLDLGKVYNVSRIRGVFAPRNGDKFVNKKVRIMISDDDRITPNTQWKTPVINGNCFMRQAAVRYEFGVSYPVRWIKFEVTKWNWHENLQIHQFQIFEDPSDYPEPKPVDPEMAAPYQNEARHANIASGQATVIERGIPIAGWMPSGGYGRGVPTEKESEEFGWDGPLFYDPPFQNPDFMNYNPHALWGIAKAPFGGNGMGAAGEPREFVDKSMLPYIRNAVSFCFGDEGNYSSAEAKRFGDWFAWSKEHYPGVIMHSNQAGGSWASLKIMKEYMNIAKPDMLSYDDYYYDLPNRVRDASRYLLGSNLPGSNPLWNLQRQTALQGVDGTGRKPILFGQYLDTFNFDQPVSQKNLVANLSLLSGMKWLNFFRLEFQMDGCYLWDEDGTPTRGLFEWGEPLHNIKHISPQLTRLTNDWVMTQPGEHSGAATGWHMGDFRENPKKNAEFGISDVAAVNVGGIWSGERGDVVLGYFNALPGLSEKELAENFNGATAPKAFMLLNGLNGGTAGSWSNPNVAGKEAGDADNTRQEITVTVNADHPTLYRVNKKTDTADPAHFEEVAIDEHNTFTVSLGGGEAELYFWGIDTSASASSAADGHSAAFAFDGDPGTYWQADDSAPDDITLENTFPLRGLDRVVLNEFGSAVTGFRLEYQAADANGTWTPIPDAQGTKIGDSLSLSFTEVQAQGIRLVITKSQGAPGIRELRVYGPVPPPSGPQTLTINDNTLGTGINRFSYDEKWSYRETVDGVGLPGMENQDVHFSNFADAKATLTFYGTQVELKFRDNGKRHFTLQMDDDPAEDFQTGGTGGGNTVSKIFSNLELGVHHLSILRGDVPPGMPSSAIDCAVVTYEGEIPADAPNADLQTYVDQTSKGTGKNQFEYDPAPTVTADRAPTGEDAGWVEHTQKPGDMNGGWTGTAKANAAYTLHFYGTGVTLYAGQNVWNSAGGNPKASYGIITMSLDGDAEQPVTYQNIDNVSGKGGLSVPVLHVDAADTTKNAMHTLKIITKSGNNRIDYAVVSSLPETGATYQVSVSVTEGGTYKMTPENGQVAKNGDAVIAFTPEGGKRLASVIANGYRQELQGNQLYLLNVTADQTVSASFEPIPAPPVETTYQVTVSATGGGTYTMTPESGKVTEHGDAVITFTPAENYRLASVTVNDQVQQVQGNQLSLSDITENKTVSASFELISTPPVETTYRVSVSVTEGGTYTMTPVSGQVTEHGDAVITFAPAENYRLASVTVNGQAQQMQGNQLSLSDITEDKAVSASFELISTPPTPPTPPTPTLPPQGTVTYPEDTAAPETSVTPETPMTPDVIPEKQVAQEIKNSPEKSVTVELKGPAVANGDLFGAIRDTGKALTLAVKTPDGKLAYQWEFAGKDILYPQLSMNIGIQTEDALSITGHSGMLLEYEHSGTLPGGATVTVNVAEQFKDGAQLYYYYWTPASGVYEEVASGITVKDGMAKFPMTHCSAYLLTDQKIANAIIPSKPEKNPATGDRLPAFPGWMLLAAGVLLLTRRSLRKGRGRNAF